MRAQSRKILLTGEHTLARMQGVRKTLPAFLLGRPNPRVVQMMNIVTHHGLDNRHHISSIFLALTLDFLCYSPATISLLSPYSYAIHGPVRKPSCSQFNTSESASVIITAVESSG